MNLQTKRRIRRNRIDTQPTLNDRFRQVQLENENSMPRNTKLYISNSPNNKLKLMPIRSSFLKGHTQPKNKSKIDSQRAKSHLGNQLQQLKGDISKIRHEIMSNRSKKKIENHINHQIAKANEQASYSLNKPAKRQLFKPFWKDAHNKKSGKKYNPSLVTSQNNQHSVSESQQQEQHQNQSLYFPIIEKGRRERQQKSRAKERNQSQDAEYSPQRLREYFHMFRNQRSERTRINRASFRKIAHAVLFTIYLRNFNERMRQRRKRSFDKFVSTQLTNKLLQLKELIIQHSNPFFNAVSQQYNFDFCPNSKDYPKLRKQKLKHVKKLVNMQIQCLKQAVSTILMNKQTFAQLFYYLCRHGSYSCFHCVYTSEEINLMCISEYHGYLRAQKQLEKSALISLVFIKLVLFNVLMDRPLLIEIFGNQDAAVLTKAILLVGNILYQLFIDIQDDCLEQAPSIYKIGNWQQLKHRMNFSLAQNMTIKEGFFQKNQLISGLEDHIKTIELYGIKDMVSEKEEIWQMVKQLHKIICNHHDKVRQKSYIK